MREIHFLDGYVVSGAANRKDISCVIYPGDICIIEPGNPLNKANGHRGRKCRFTGKKKGRDMWFTARVEFLDDKGGYGYVDPCDLKPFADSQTESATA